MESKADLLIEPLVGFNVGEKLKIDGGEQYKGNGVGFGGRLGYQNLGFQLGLDYLKSSLKMTDSDFKSNLETSEWAGFVGFKFPILLRIYAGYIFSATGEASKYNNGTSTDKLQFSNGTGSKVGIGFTGLPFLSINLEYRSGKFDEYKFGGTKGTETTKYSSYLLSLSVPLTL